MVKGFFGPHRYLSNFYIEPDGTFVEFEFQRAKCSEFHQRQDFDDLLKQGRMTPQVAKAMGRRVQIREDWEDVKVNIMLFYVTKKFKDHDQLWLKLKLTDGLLEETNTWGDTFWGVCNGRGLNMLGAILMQVREDV